MYLLWVCNTYNDHVRVYLSLPSRSFLHLQKHGRWNWLNPVQPFHPVWKEFHHHNTKQSILFLSDFFYTASDKPQGIWEVVKMILDLVTLLHHKLNLSFEATSLTLKETEAHDDTTPIPLKVFKYSKNFRTKLHSSQLSMSV